MEDQIPLHKIGQKKQYAEEIRLAAKGMYLRRFSVAEIGQALNVPPRTVYYWCSIGKWDDLLTHESAEEAINRRLTLLAERDNKTGGELKEFDTLLNSLERLHALRLKKVQAELAPYLAPGQGDSRQPQAEGEKPRSKKKTIRNDVSHLTEEDFAEKVHPGLFAYQHTWRDNIHQRNRFILKSRQIGATWYFAQEAFEQAVLHGRNQIFLSATKAQAEIFRVYIIALAQKHFGIELKGNPLILHTRHGMVEMHFLSTSSRSAQGYHGDVYMDEVYWMPKFADLFKVASGMSAHKKWRRTLFSTPSAVTHQAYAKWSGDEYQSRFKKPKPWVSKAELHAGIVCPDGMWRHIVTLEDAIAGGCDLFDIDEIRMEYTPEQYKQLFDCQFVDDTQSVFRMAALEGCMADSADWGLNLNQPRPLGNRGVWGGYDPSRNRDDASFCILLPPLKEGEKIRVIERHTWRDKNYLWQAQRINELCQKYRFDHMGIDTTGPGIGVFEQVRQFLPLATPIVYGVQSKARLVLKAQEVIEQDRLEWEAAETDIAQAFMMVKQVPLPSGGVTYAAQRTDTTGHADVAWAIMHALSYEPLARTFGNNQSMVGIAV